MDVRFCVRQEPQPRGTDCTRRVLEALIWALSRAPGQDPCFLLTKTYMEVGYTEAIHFDGLSANRRLGADGMSWAQETVGRYAAR
jgi:hypothetical protein